MIVDGHQVAARIYKSLAQKIANGQTPAPHLTIVTCAPNAVTQRYLRLKLQRAREVGIHVSVVELPRESDTAAVSAAVATAADRSQAIVVQLPLPAHIETDTVLQAIPASHDVDCLRSDIVDTPFISPVAGAIRAIIEEQEVVVQGASVVVFGAGKLVGQPVANWFVSQGAQVTVMTETNTDWSLVERADIIVTGVGKPDLLQPDHVRPGVVLFDAGTSESSGELRGDIAAPCASKAALFTPVPGGIGPITIAALLQQVVLAAQTQSAENS